MKFPFQDSLVNLKRALKSSLESLILTVFLLVDNDNNKRSLTGSHKGFGFVEFESADDAKAAIDNMHLSEMFGRVVKCSYARPLSMKDGSGKPVWLNEEYIEEMMKNMEKGGEVSEVEELPNQETTSITEIITNRKVFMDITVAGDLLGTLTILVR